VSSPESLAAFLLDTPGDRWTAERVKRELANGQNRNVRLPHKARVYLTYRTAWVEHDGSINFRPDIYRRDEKLLPSTRSLFAASAAMGR
jgi:murein L,D-transpeptidase YcbB/YkuD